MGKRKRGELAGGPSPLDCTSHYPHLNHHHHHLQIQNQQNQQHQQESSRASPVQINHNELQVNKRKVVSRASLNFSIESIMSSPVQQVSSSASVTGMAGSSARSAGEQQQQAVRSCSSSPDELEVGNAALRDPQVPLAYSSDVEEELSCSRSSSVDSRGSGRSSGSRSSAASESSSLVGSEKSAQAHLTTSKGKSLKQQQQQQNLLNSSSATAATTTTTNNLTTINNSNNSTRSSSASGASVQASSNGNSTSATTNALLKPKICKDPRLAPFQCQLDNIELWNRFHNLDTEMIITKQGRRMFPPVRVTFSVGLGGAAYNSSGCDANSTASAEGYQVGLEELNPREKYQVLMDILPFDGKRYRYAYHKSSWQQAGKADPPSPTKLFLHPDGPFTLEQLKRQVISFEKIKLTNNDANKHGYIVLNSMHKYQPRIHLVLWRGSKDASSSLANAPITQLDQEIHKTFIFSETIFTAVTAYQNHSITKLKIDSNPFAKGFRDSSRLTDLELESMQDLMSEGQCPFSPPRAPPHGFPHFLFAAAAGAGQLEDPASTLLRERTIMALDSFLQQQQQQQQQQQSASPSARSNGAPPNCPSTQATPGQHNSNLHPHLPPGPPPPYSSIPFGNFLMSPQQQQQQKNSATVTSAPNQQVPPNHLEQLIMQQQQQQQQFAAAAAMAAAAAVQHNHPLHSLFNSTSGAINHSNLSHSQTQQQQQLPLSGKHLQAGGNRAGNASCSPIQLSPNFNSLSSSNKSPSSNSTGNHQSAISHLQQQSGNSPGNFSQQPQGGAPGANLTPATHYAFHPQHLHAMMAAHHQHQMAAQMAQMQQQLEQSAAAANRQLLSATSHLDASGNQHLSHQLSSSGTFGPAGAGLSGNPQAHATAKNNLL